jgi:hypothetical protein
VREVFDGAARQAMRSSGGLVPQPTSTGARHAVVAQSGLDEFARELAGDLARCRNEVAARDLIRRRFDAAGPQQTAAAVEVFRERRAAYLERRAARRAERRAKREERERQARHRKAKA